MLPDEGSNAMQRMRPHWVNESVGQGRGGISCTSAEERQAEPVLPGLQLCVYYQIIP